MFCGPALLNHTVSTTFPSGHLLLLISALVSSAHLFFAACPEPYQMFPPLIARDSTSSAAGLPTLLPNQYLFERVSNISSAL